MNRILTSIGAAILTAVLAFGSIPVYAADGSLTLIPKVGDVEQSAAAYQGTFKIYQIATYANDGSYQLTGTFDGCKVLLSGDTVMTESNAAVVTQFLKDNSIDPTIPGVTVGQSVELNKGMYYVCQDSNPAEGYSIFSPFLVAIPSYDPESKEMITSITAYPKVSKTTPPEEPDNPDNPPDNPPPETPPTTPPEEPETPEDEGGEETPPSPSEDIGGMDENGNMNENGELNEGGALTGDNSQIVTYGVVAGVAAIALILWFVWKRKKNQQ